MHYPEQRFVSPLMVIRRNCFLPDEALGSVRTKEGNRVDMRDVVANGVIPSHYFIVNGLEFFGLRKPDQLEPLLQVDVGDTVEAGDVLAGKRIDRGKRLRAPVDGNILAIRDGKFVIQEMPEVIDLEAGVNGRVVSVQPGRGVQIEAVGALVQATWGNGRRVIGTMRAEPEEGLVNMSGDSLERRFTGTVVLTRQPLTVDAFDVVAEHSLLGIIAPSMDAALVDMALETSSAILLTEGFGAMRMNSTVFGMLSEFVGQPVTLDALRPDRWETQMPEVIINVPFKRSDRPNRPNTMLTLRPDMNVRITREPYLGLTGRIVHLPKSPVLLDNGLRVPSAQVELVVGETVFVPLVNLEVLGR